MWVGDQQFWVALHSQLIIIKMSYRKINLLNYFIRNSPANQHRSFAKVITITVTKQQQTHTLSNDEYVQKFFNSLEVIPPSNAIFYTIKNKSRSFSPHLRKVFPSLLVKKIVTPGIWQQPKQLIESIKQVSSQTGEGIVSFHELEQRLEIASPQSIANARTNLIYLFKILINKREKIDPLSIQLDANLQLSLSIINALSKCQNSERAKQNLKELQAMEKLLRARQYHKKGLKQIALSNFQQICRDQAASSQTRLEALKILCSFGQQVGDASVLQSLVGEMQALGKQCLQTIMSSLQRIKQAKN